MEMHISPSTAEKGTPARRLFIFMKRIETVENSATLALEAKGLQLYRLDELTEERAHEIVKASNEPEMLERVPEDHGRRFPDVERALEWYRENNRIVYALGGRATLAGLAWFTERPFPDPDVEADYTYAIRLYKAARDQGLGKAVMAATHADFRQVSRYEGPTWLSVKDTNAHAKRLYDKFGYAALGNAGDKTSMLRSGSVGYGTEEEVINPV
jgi:ribosomal protein S18 acetylase RimI-like enzyme